MTGRGRIGSTLPGQKGSKGPINWKAEATGAQEMTACVRDFTGAKVTVELSLALMQVHAYSGQVTLPLYI